MIREMLKQNIVKDLGLRTVDDLLKPVAISFSGGTDSLCIFFTCLDLGIKNLTLYTYYADPASEDLRRARLISKMFNVPLVECPIPSDIRAVYANLVKMVDDGIEGKVCLECMHGHYMVAPKVKERFILNGSGIDGVYGSYKEFFLSEARTEKEVFDEKRKKHLENPNDDAMVYQSECYKYYGDTTVLYPYRQKNIIDYLMSKSYREIMTPKWKSITVNEFPEITNVKGLWRARGSQQVVSGTRELHIKLLCSEFNMGNRTNISKFYNDLIAERKHRKL
jgi:asparagine synthetase B (glutamine-hydrolysing)